MSDLNHYSADGIRAACGASPVGGLGDYSTDPRLTECSRCERTRLWKLASARGRERRAANRAAHQALPIGRALRAVLGENCASVTVEEISDEDMAKILFLKAEIQRGASS